MKAWVTIPIARIQGCDVRVARNSFLIPGPVDEDHDASHGTTSLPKPSIHQTVVTVDLEGKIETTLARGREKRYNSCGSDRSAAPLKC